MIEISSATKIEAVDQEIRDGFRYLVFTPDLERRYETDTKRDRARTFIISGQIAIVLYDLFLISDWQMTPDVFKEACIARLLVFTPLFLLSWWVVSRNPPDFIREGMAAGMAVLSVVLVDWLLLCSRSPDLALYVYGTVLIMMFFAVVQRLRIRYAATMIGIIIVIQFYTISHLDQLNGRMVTTALTFYLTAAVLLLWATYSLERQERRGYLLELRSRLLNDHLDDIAKHDALTGLWNRRHLDTVMASAWSGAFPRSMSVILLDIDHFKSFNDSYGHPQGDKCLQQVAACVRNAVENEENAIAVRFGGEEFLVFIDGMSAGAARHVAERIQSMLKKNAIPHPARGAGAIVSASFGIATGHAPSISADRLVSAADDALYVAKRAGRDCIWPVLLESGGTALETGLPLAVAC